MASPNIERMKARKDIEGLIKAFKYKGEAYVRHEAAWALGEIGEPAVERLIQASKDEDIQQYVAIALGLTKDARAAEPLIQLLNSEYEVQGNEIQINAIFGLEVLGDARAVEPLIQALKDESLREYAVMALGHIGDARAIEPLTQIKNEDENWEVQWHAGDALDEIQEKESQA